MAEVNLSIAGRSYKLACRDGEEDALLAAAGLLESRVSSLMEAHGAIAEPRLLLMAALLVSGELLERKANEARQTPAAARELPAMPESPSLEILEGLAIRAETLATKLETTSSAV